MNNQNFIIPRKIKAGFQKRHQSLDGALAFLTYITPDARVFNEARFNSWRDTSIAPQDIDNSPQSGFVLGEGVEHGGRFSNSQFYVRVYSTTHNVEFEISMNDFLALATYTRIDKRYIEGDCVIAWNNNKITLLSIYDPRYARAKEASDVLYSKRALPIKDKYELGDLFIVKNSKKKTLINKDLVYIGLYDIHQVNYNGKIRFQDFKCVDGSKFELIKKTKPKHVFALFRENLLQNEKLHFSTEILTFDTINPEELTYTGSVEDYPEKITEGTDNTEVSLASIKEHGIQYPYTASYLAKYIATDLEGMSRKTSLYRIVRHFTNIHLISEDYEIYFIPEEEEIIGYYNSNPSDNMEVYRMTVENGKISYVKETISLNKQFFSIEALGTMKSNILPSAGMMGYSK